MREALARSRKAFDDSEREKVLADEAKRETERAQRRELEAEAARARARLAEQEAKATAARAELEADAARVRASLAEQKAKAAAAENALYRQQVRMTRIGAFVAFVLLIIAAALGFNYYRSRESYAEALEREESLVATAADGILIAPKLVGAADSLNLLTAVPVPAWTNTYFDEAYKTLPYLREIRRVTHLVPGVNDQAVDPPIFSVSFNPRLPLLVAVSAGGRR